MKNLSKLMPREVNQRRRDYKESSLYPTPNPIYGCVPFGVIPYPTFRFRLIRLGLSRSLFVTVIISLCEYTLILSSVGSYPLTHAV